MTHRITTVAAITAAVLALIGVLVFTTGDTHVLVPSPESTAEGFVREIVTSRYRQTRQYVASDARARVTPSRVKEWRTGLEARAGRVDQVDPAGASIAGDRAVAQLRLRARRGQIQVIVPMHRQHGLWKIDDLPAYQEEHR
jgi:hypothetical protein